MRELSILTAWRAARWTRLAKFAFVVTAAYAGTLFWLAPHPPMADLPQHAGQVALLRDLLLERSPWQSLLRINYFTPYWIGYGPASMLSLLMPVAAALKLMLTLAYYAFVICCVLLRRHFQGDERLDWLFIPGFFGMVYVWGFFTFLVAAPLGLLFILLADRYAVQPTAANGIRLAVLGLVLFFSHGLVFIFASSIGLGLLAVRLGFQQRPLLVALLPYVPLLALGTVYAAAGKNAEAAMDAFFPAGIVWRWDRSRFWLPNHLFGGYDLRGVIFAAIASVFMMWSPRLLGSPLNRRNPAAFVPMATVLLVWLAVPHYAMKTSLLFERFALFVLPLYAMMFGRPTAPRRLADGRTFDGLQSRVCQALLALLCWVFLGAQTQGLFRFAQESEDFDTVRLAAEPGQRALGMVFDTNSAAARNPWAYLNYPLWYQAENGGLVDFNSAWFPPQVVRFRTDRLPAVRPDFSMEPQSFNWNDHRGWEYRYFFVRHSQPIPEDMFENRRCQVALLKSAGPWSLYETRGCHGQARGPVTAPG